jgi:putative membrane protein (TIGR04086 family)
MGKQSRYENSLLMLLASCFLGHLSFVFPSLWAALSSGDPLSLVVLVSPFRDDIFIGYVVCLFLSGLVVGRAISSKWLLIGLLTVFPVILATVLDSQINPSKYTLLPVVIMQFVFMSIPGSLGAFVGHKLNRT